MPTKERNRMKKLVEQIKKKMEEIMLQTCAFSDNDRKTMEECVRAVKLYLDKIKAIKSYRVNCHGKFDENIGTIAILTVVLIPHEGKPITLKAEMWPSPSLDFLPENLDFVAGKPTKKLTSRR